MEFDLQREVDYYCSLFLTLVNKRLKIKKEKKYKLKKIINQKSFKIDKEFKKLENRNK